MKTYPALAPLRSSLRLSRSLWKARNFNFAGILKDLIRFLREYKAFSKQKSNTNFALSQQFLYPCLNDRTTLTPIEPTYFYQDAWAAGWLFKLRPSQHYDVGSSAKTIGIISQFVPTTMVDIRPVDIYLENLNFVEGSILNLPFADGSIESLSSLCVVEHIGLGRYGDPLDTWGSEKAIQSLTRVLKPDGHLLISIPIDSQSRVYFNAHRSFTRDHVMSLFSGMELKEERYIYGRRMCDAYDPGKGFGTGLFYFQKKTY